MFEQIKKNFKDSDKKILLIVGACLLLILIIGSTYAYFVINNQNNATSSNVQGDFASQGKVSLNTNISDLYLNLNGILMSQEKTGTKYFATTNSNGVPITNATEGNGIYTLAIASLESGTTKYNCTYKYKITATLNSPITDGSDEDIKLKFTGSSITSGSREYTLKELINAGANGVEFSGMFQNLTAGNNQTITIESTVENTSNKQDDFAGNKYNINISPLPGSEGFSCEINYIPPTVVVSLNGDTITANVTKGDNELDSYCINNESIPDNCTWNKLTGTEINYNPTSTGTYYVHVKDIKDKIGTSEGIYFEQSRFNGDLIATGELWQSGLEGDGYRYTGSGNATAGTTPKNFVCFGTNDKATCTGNPNTYMYRIIGVFPDASGAQYVKLIKYASLPSAMRWNANYSNDIAWEASDLYNNLNGSTFLSNTTYVPNSTWSNKIANWKWTAVNTLTYESSGPNYTSVTTTQMYLHEMNRSNKSSTIGAWTTPSAKIGLMYASDYQMSLGASSLNYTGSSNASILKTGWMFIDNNSDTTGISYEWTISRRGLDGSYYRAWYVYSDGYVDYDGSVISILAVRPTFYLNPDVELQSGTGTITDPYILK